MVYLGLVLFLDDFHMWLLTTYLSYACFYPMRGFAINNSDYLYLELQSTTPGHDDFKELVLRHVSDM